MKITTKKLVISGVIAALYAVLTLFLAPISYGPIQCRISEFMVLLAYFDPFYIIGLTLGCFIANLYSTPMDVIFGTFATLISVTMIYVTSRFKLSDKVGLFIASLWPVLFNGLIVGWMIATFFAPGQTTMLVAGIEVAIGEFIAVSIIGYGIIYSLRKRIRKNFI